MKIRFAVVISFIITVLAVPFSVVNDAYAAPVQGWDAGYIMADRVFTNNTSMSPPDIQAFLNSKVPVCDTYGTQPSEFGGGTRAQWAAARGYYPPFTCLKDYSEGGKSGAQIIYDAAQEFQINPQVLIVLLQKEQSLVTDTWPIPPQYRTATGYGCPDTAPCDSQYFGLTNQVRWSARMFRSIMNASPTWYTPYVVGNNFIQYNPQSSCGGTVVNIQNRATQALYNYTPYQPNQSALDAGWGTGDSCGAYGNRNFYLYFQSWFGAPRGDYCITSLTTTKTGIMFGKDQPGQPETGKFMIYSGSGTGCIEAHGWQPGFGNWASHTATGASSTEIGDTQLFYADLNGDGKDELVLVGLKNTGSGKIEFHVLSDDMKSWTGHYISNSNPLDPTISQVSFADVDGDGKDEAVLIGLMDGSTSTGKIEFHVWNQGFGSWRDHYVSNSLTITQAFSQLSFADVDGDGKDEGVLVGLAPGGSSTGKIEFHVWNQGFGSWRDHYVSNAAVVDRAVTQLTFADVDGDRKDEAILMGVAPGGTSSGNFEFHVWNQGFGSWRSHHASNQSVN